MKKTFEIEIDCANCANLAEEAAGKVTGVKSANVNFMAQKMTIEFEENANSNDVMKNVYAACKKVEPDFEIHL